MERHTCTHCGKKMYAKYMQKVTYKLLRQNAWHCLKCLSVTVDNLQYSQGSKSKYLIEFFSGSKTFSNIAQTLYDYQICSVDIESKFAPSICKDIRHLVLHDIPERSKVFLIWASLPCTVYSINSIHTHWKTIPYSHRRYYYMPKTADALRAIVILEKLLWLIRKINPVYFIIENPRGALRHMPQMSAIPFRYTVSYNDFGSDLYKPTDLFSNIPGLQLPQVKTSVGRSFAAHVNTLSNAYERAILPPELCHNLLTQIDKRHFQSSVTTPDHMQIASLNAPQLHIQN